MRYTLIASGCAAMAYAAAGAVGDPDVRITGVLTFLAAVVIGHDVLLLPLTIAAGALLRRFIPSRDRAAVRAAALCSLAVGVIALPLVLGYGRVSDNPSVLPLPYGRGLLLTLAVIWSAALVAIVLGRLRADRPWRSRKNSERSADAAHSAAGG